MFSFFSRKQPISAENSATAPTSNGGSANTATNANAQANASPTTNIKANANASASASTHASNVSGVVASETTTTASPSTVASAVHTQHAGADIVAIEHRAGADNTTTTQVLSVRDAHLHREHADENAEDERVDDDTAFDAAFHNELRAELDNNDTSTQAEHAAQDAAQDAERSAATAQVRDAAHAVLERVDSLGHLDQKRSDDIEKAIEKAEAETAVKIEREKGKKEKKDKESKKDAETKTEQERKTWLAKTKDNVKYTFISKETEEAFGEILILFDKMFDDFPYSKVDLLLGLMMLDDYYKNAPILTAARVDDYDFIETTRYYMKFAYCCYGWKFVYGILKRKTRKFIKSMVGVDANIKALYDCTGVEPKDVVVAKWSSNVFDPGHYICICHERKSIVVAFRGTFHLRDALTDLVASNTPFMQGTAHTGLLRTANNKFRVLAPIVLKCVEEYQGYKVIVVGHSLGAGTASLFSLIFHEAHPEVDMHCYAYAPPGVVSPDVALSSSTAELIDSIVVGTDIVPRLSFATLTHLKKIIVQILGSGNNTFQRAFQWMAGGMGDRLKQRVGGMLKIPEPAKVEPTPVPLSDISVFPPGRLILLVPHTLEVEVVEERDDDGVESEGEGAEMSSPFPSNPPNSSPPATLSPIQENTLPSIAVASSPPLSDSPNLTSPPLPASNFIRNDAPPSTPTSTTSSSSLNTPPLNRRNSLRRRLSDAMSPGKYFNRKPKVKKQKPMKVFLMEYSNSAFFNEIIISPTMFTSHMPSSYDRALESCLNIMQQIKEDPQKLSNITLRM